MKIHLLFMFSTLIGGAVFFSPSSTAEACSARLSWEHGTFIWFAGLEHGRDSVDVPGEAGLMIRLDAEDLPEFETYRPFLQISVWGPDDVEVPGRIEPTLRHDVIQWVPETPLNVGTQYQLQSDLSRFQIVPPQTASFRVIESTPRSGISQGTITGNIVDETVFGACLDTVQTNCVCFEREVLGQRTRFAIDFTTQIPSMDWPGAVSARYAVGTSLDEARANLTEAPFRRWTQNMRILASPIEQWPSPEICGALEVYDPYGELVLQKAECTPITSIDSPPDPIEPDTRSNIGDLENSEDTSGCSSPQGSSFFAWMLLPIAALVRRKG